MPTSFPQPVPVSEADIVGYMGKEFIILRLAKKPERELPDGLMTDKTEMFGVICPPCVIKNNQSVAIACDGVMTRCTLHDINGKWHLLAEDGKLAALQDGTWFEIRRPVLT